VLNRFGSQINLGKCQKMEKEIKFGGGVKENRARKDIDHHPPRSTVGRDFRV
jgi:hypothetical protein